jgi:hypothetical protein
VAGDDVGPVPAPATIRVALSDPEPEHNRHGDHVSHGNRVQHTSRRPEPYADSDADGIADVQPAAVAHTDAYRVVHHGFADTAANFIGADRHRNRNRNRDGHGIRAGQPDPDQVQPDSDPDAHADQHRYRRTVRDRRAYRWLRPV